MTDDQDAPRASLALLRRITDRHVLDQLLASPAMTRAEVAAATGISKPTVSESVRRLERDGLVEETGRREPGTTTTRRGPAGVGYALRDDLGVALTLDGGPGGLVAEVLDLRGTVLRRVERSTPSPVPAAVLGPALVDLVGEATADLPGPVRACSLAVAGPVDRADGRMVRAPGSPFLVDELDPRTLLGSVGALADVVVDVDNDVNWAATAEHDAGVASGLDDFCYLHLGHGIGGAVFAGGRIVRGHDGLAGEPAHLLTTGPGGRATTLLACLDELGLVRPGTHTIDVVRAREVLDAADGSADEERRDAVVVALVGVLTSVAALLNPSAVVVGGPWATTAGVARLAARAGGVVVPPTRVVPATLGLAAPLLGAQVAAVRALRARLFEAPAGERAS